MQYEHDAGGSKLLFLAIAALIIYLAFFQFNVVAAYQYAIQSYIAFFQIFR